MVRINETSLAFKYLLWRFLNLIRSDDTVEFAGDHRRRQFFEWEKTLIGFQTVV